MAMLSRERGEPPPLCAEDADEYGDGGSGRSCPCPCPYEGRGTVSASGRLLRAGGGERDVRRRLRGGACGEDGAGRSCCDWLLLVAEPEEPARRCARVYGFSGR